MNTAEPRVAVIGCGAWGPNVARAFARLGALAAVVDEIPSRADELAGRYMVPAREWSSILQDSTINAVALATPAASHATMAIQALQSGKHVLIEKPLALSLEDGERIAQAAIKSNRIAMVGHLFQYHPAFNSMKALVHSGELGQIRQIYSTRMGLGRVRHVENALWSLAPHDLSMILALVQPAKEQPEVVMAHGTCHLHTDIADAVTAHLQFPNGVHAQLSVSWLYPSKERKLVVVGDDGMAVLDDLQPWEKKLVVFKHAIARENGIPEIVKGPAKCVALAEAEPLFVECHHLLTCIRDQQEPATSLDEGLAVLRLLNDIQSALDHSKLSIPARRTSNELREASASTGRLRSGSLGCQVHETANIESGAMIGRGTQIWHFSHILPGARVGENCKIGQNVMIDRGVIVGKNCKIQNNVSIYSGVVLEDGVFCGPSCVFTNVLTPRAEVERKNEFMTTIVRRGATIGANSTIVCGLELGHYCMIGAGAVVTKSVKPHALVVGNPSKQIGWVSATGERLGPELLCPRTGGQYALRQGPDDTQELFLLQHESVDEVATTAVQPQSLPTGAKELATLVPLVDRPAQISRIRIDLDKRISKVLDEANFIGGPEVAELELRLAEFTKASHVVSCACGTDALTLSLMALEVQPKDAVLVPTFGFIASVEPIALLGAVPVFLDITPDTLTINPRSITLGVETARAAGFRPVGIVAVDIFGHPADYDAINLAASKHNLWVIADAAQSFGARLADGRRVGTLATITTTSFFPAKPLGCFGDGGAVMTEDPMLAGTIRSLARHGRTEADKFDSDRVGMNSRLDTIQAAVLLAKLDKFQAELDKRQAVAANYTRLLGDAKDKMKGIFDIALPTAEVGVFPTWASYTLRIYAGQVGDMRSRLGASLLSHGFQSAIYYPKLIHTMTPYARHPVAGGRCPVAEQMVNELFSLPMSPILELPVQSRIVEALLDAGFGLT